MNKHPQVVLFGSIAGGWREQHIIPVLEDLHVSYYNPAQDDGWSTQSGDVEADVMSACETIVMVFNQTSPSFTALAEAGWAALGCALRNQHVILCIDLDFAVQLAPEITASEQGRDLQRALQHWAASSRYLVDKHARAFNHPRLHVVDDLAQVAAKLREIYSPSSARI